MVEVLKVPMLLRFLVNQMLMEVYLSVGKKTKLPITLAGAGPV